MDIMTKEQRRYTMRQVKNKNTSIEILLRKALWNKGVRYRKNPSKILGKPDICIKKYKLAIFCDSEFWHGKTWLEGNCHFETNGEYWKNKIERNIARDAYVNKALSERGWIILRFWEKEIRKNTDQCVNKILMTIKQLKNVND